MLVDLAIDAASAKPSDLLAQIEHVDIVELGSDLLESFDASLVAYPVGPCLALALTACQALPEPWEHEVGATIP